MEGLVRGVIDPVVLPAIRKQTGRPAGGGLPLVFGWDVTTLAGPASFDTDGRRVYTASSPTRVGVTGLQGRSAGKWYFELTGTGFSAAAGSQYIGIALASWNESNLLGAAGGGTNGIAVSGHGYSTYYNGSTGNGRMDASYPGTAGAVTMVAVDFDAKKVWFGVNGSWKYSGNPAAGTNPQLTPFADGEWFPAFSNENQATAWGATLHERATDQTYPPPDGFSPWAGG